MQKNKINGKKVFSFEGQVDEFFNELKKWLDNPHIGELSLKIEDVSIKYKRDTQNAINTAITAKAEKKLIAWLCPRIPKWVNSDMLTIFGFLGSLLISVSLVVGFFHKWVLLLIPVGFFINWFGDSLDGSLARYRKCGRPNFGYYIDKMVDGITAFILPLGMGLSGFIKIEIAMIFACMYLLMMMHVHIVVHIKNECKNSFGLIGPTEVRIIASAIAIYMYFTNVNYYNVYGHYITQFDIVVLAFSMIMFLILVVDFFKTLFVLHKRDTKV